MPPGVTFEILDCGARGGNELLKWASLGEYLVMHGFEADEAECQRLNASFEQLMTRHAPRCPRVRYYPLCLGGKDLPRQPFYVTNLEHSCSLYPPNDHLIARWKQKAASHIFPVKATLGLERVVEVSTTTLDRWADTHGVGNVDFIKLDVQGAELDVMKGGQQMLRSVIGVEVEVEFVPLYKGQPLFADVDVFLRQRGFTFFNLQLSHGGHFVGRLASPITRNRSAAYPPFQEQIDGQLVTMDALYLIDPLEPGYGNPSSPLNKLLKLAAIAEVCGQVEYAFEVLSHVHKSLHSMQQQGSADLVAQVIKEGTNAYLAQEQTAVS